MPDIEFRGFSWRHAGRANHAVKDVDLTIKSGQRVLLLGASGAGKSTLLHAVAGLLPEDSGEQTGQVLIDGIDARQRQNRVGIVFQDPQSQLVMQRSGDDVAFGLENRGVNPNEIWPKVDKALSAVGFEYGTEHPTNALSGGEQQRLVLAGAIANEPSVLLLDEPTANLDPHSAQEVRTAIGHTTDNSDTTLIVIEHRVSDILHLIDRVIFLETRGGIVSDGSPDDIFTKHGPWLSEHGVWVPGNPGLQQRLSPGAGKTTLIGTQLGLTHGHAKRPALADIDLTLHDTELIAVTGPSGSGKSSLALIAGGLTAPTTGHIIATGAIAPTRQKPLHRLRASELASRVGSVFQNPEHQFVAYRVRDELTTRRATPKWNTKHIQARADELLQRLRLDHLADANPFTLSGGEARRLSVATALIAAPRVLILDEPTFGQDFTTWREIIDLIADLRDNGTSILTVTHDMDLVDTIADRRITLDKGRPC